MASPIIKLIIPFDASKNYDIGFVFNGFQVRKNKAIIRNNATSEIVYEKEIVSTLLKHTVDANSLANGNTYNIEIQVFDVNGNPSVFSNATVFTCVSTPLFYFNNLNNNDVVKDSYINLELKYEQPDGELLNTYYVQLYNYSKTLIYKSDVKTSLDLFTMIAGLEENAQYYVRAIGETVNHIPLDTGYVSFVCDYLVPSTFTYLELKNKKKEASVSITSNIISIEGKCNKEPIYIDNKEIDLTEDGVSVVFDEAFEIPKNFTEIRRVRKLTNFKEFYIGKNKNTNKGFRLIWWTYNNHDTETPEYSAVKLEVDGVAGKYALFSNRIPVPSDNDYISIWFKRVKNLYELKIENLGGD